MHFHLHWREDDKFPSGAARLVVAFGIHSEDDNIHNYEDFVFALGAVS